MTRLDGPAAAAAAARAAASARPTPGPAPILITGFEPFGGESTNPSSAAAERAVALLNDSGVPAVFLEVPCVFATAGSVVQAEAERIGARIVICAGLAGNRARISLERIAINLNDARIEDNAGAQPVDEEVLPGLPLAFATRLPVKRALRALNAARIPAELSFSAGSFVCNALFYYTLAKLPVGTPTGFVHVPLASEMGVDKQARALAIVARETVAALEESAAAGRVVDFRFAAGVES
ncbi:Pyrrolidone-carboxylate peptidase [Vanrija pseudolonga]|uniref:Pyroglutamyl-peptidase I n=1 Tax=Vanrija pseudolonga TaxID=143232 RepID=A0AAF0Y3G9_9TREE|nr:Pyrrolidone-carboxylate peptidase [Vanrija pseudolonga]